MFKEEPSVCGTQCTTRLGQGEKAKTKKVKQKGIFSHKTRGKKCHEILMQWIKKKSLKNPQKLWQILKQIKR